MASSLVAGVAVHPACGLLITAGSCLAYLARASYDCFMYYAAVRYVSPLISDTYETSFVTVSD